MEVSLISHQINVPINQIDKTFVQQFVNKLKCERKAYTVVNNLSFLKKMWLAKKQQLVTNSLLLWFAAFRLASIQEYYKWRNGSVPN